MISLKDAIYELNHNIEFKNARMVTEGEVAIYLEELQRYIDLEKQGRLIELPCAVGDTVYYITGIHNTLIKSAKVEELYFGDVFAVHVSTQNTSFTLVEGEFFITKEEAEAALKESEKE